MSVPEIRWIRRAPYGVQGPFGVFVERIAGNYFNVIGMPLPLLYRMLLDAGVLKENRT